MSTNPTPFKPNKPKGKKKGIPPILIVALVLFLGLSASVSIWNYVNQSQEEVKKQEATRPVAVAARPIMAGSAIVPEDLVLMDFPALTVPPDYPDMIEPLLGMIAMVTIQPNEVITQDKLLQPGVAAGLATLIPQGNRAITIRVNEITGVGGFIAPGDHVDILTDFEDPSGTAPNQRFTKTLLQNVQVIAAGDMIYDPNIVSDHTPKVVNQITVSLLPKDAEKLSLATAHGEIRLVLRSRGDEAPYEGLGISNDEVFNIIAYDAPSGISPEAEQVIAPTITRSMIDIILGGYRTAYYY